MSQQPVVAGVDVGNATTEAVLVTGRRILGTARLPTRGRKGSPESLRGAAAVLRRLERELGRDAAEVKIAPLRAVDTATVTIPAAPPPTGRLRVLAAGVATPGGTGACVGAPVWLGQPPLGEPDGPAVAVVPPGMTYQEAASRLRALLAGPVPVGAVLVAGDEGVLIANRLGAPLPVIDQVDVAAAADCPLVAVEVSSPGQPLTVLGDPVALAAAFSLAQDEASGAVAVARALVDYSNAVVGCAETAATTPGPGTEPWVLASGERLPLREAIAHLPRWPVGTVQAFGAGGGESTVDDVFGLDLAAVADTATARRGSLGRAAVVASLQRLDAGGGHAGELASLLGRPVRSVLTEPAAARLGALTTPGARTDAVVVDVGAGTIDVITPDGEVVAAGAGELLTAAVSQALGVPRAAAEWAKRGACVRVDGGQRYEAEDGSRGFLGRPAPATAVGMLAAPGPAGLLPFDRGHAPAEWRAIRLRLKEAVFAANLRRAGAALGPGPAQVLIVGGPAADDELLGVLLRSLPGHVSAGRARVGGTLSGPAAGHRYAAALGLALAEPA